MNLKVVFAISALCTLAHINYASAPKSSDAQKNEEVLCVTMPSSKILLERLEKDGLSHFAEKTKIHEKLGGQKEFPIEVARQVEHDYDQYMKNPMMSALMKMNKGDIIQLLLQDFPEAFKQLDEKLKLSPVKCIYNNFNLKHKLYNKFIL